MKLISVREVYTRQDELLPIHLSYKTILKYVQQDFNHIFKPVSKGVGSGTRYYVTEENVLEFKKRFLNNKLKD